MQLKHLTQPLQDVFTALSLAHTHETDRKIEAHSSGVATCLQVALDSL